VAAIGLIVISGLVSYAQFWDALPPSATFRKSLKYALWGGVFTLIFFMLPTILEGVTLKHAALEIAFIAMLYLGCGLVVGDSQFLRLMAEGFDAYQHQKLIGNSAAVRASQLGILPYRERVGAFWRIVAMAAPVITLFALSAAFGFTGEGPGTLLIVDLVLAGFGIFKIRENIKFLREPRIVFLEGQVVKSRGRSGRNIVLYLTCNQRKFMTHDRIWSRILDGQIYRLWYSAVNNRIIAYEQLG
jgi:hypothetical protein